MATTNFFTQVRDRSALRIFEEGALSFIQREMRQPTTMRERFDEIVDEYNSDNPLHFATIFVRTHGLVSPSSDSHIAISHPQWEIMHLANVHSRMYGESAVTPYLVSTEPLGFAITYNRTYNQMTQPLVFNAEAVQLNGTYNDNDIEDVSRLEFENPYTSLEIDRLIEHRSSTSRSILRQWYQRMARIMHLPRPLTVEAMNDIQPGDIVRTTGDGSVVRANNPSDDPVVGVALSNANANDEVEIAVSGTVNVPVDSQSINAQLQALQDRMGSVMSDGGALTYSHGAWREMEHAIEDMPRHVNGHFVTPEQRIAGEDRVAIQRDRERLRGYNPFMISDAYTATPKYRKYFSAKTGIKHTPVIEGENRRGDKYMAFRGTSDVVSTKQYGGCHECFWYSLVFHAKEAPDRTKIIESDEDFEKVKGHFVKHFNKEHPEIVAKKMALKNPEKMT